MTDDRFFTRNGPFSVGELAQCAGIELPADAPSHLMMSGVAALDSAEEGDVSVFSERAHSKLFETTRASVVITNAQLSALPHNGSWLMVVRDARLAFAMIGQKFYPRDTLAGGAHAHAVIDPSAEIGRDCQIDAGAVIGREVRLGARCHVHSGAVIGAAVTIGDDCTIGANAAVSHALIGARVRIGANASIGGEGFGFVPAPTGLVSVRQLGRVVIGDDVRIGGNCAIDRGTFDDTVVGAGTVIDNLVQIGHNVRLGRCCVIAGQAGVAGSTTIGDFVMIGGQCAISDHLTIGAGARIAGRSGVMRDVGAGETVAGCPAVPVRQWHRQTVATAKLAGRKKAAGEAETD